MATRLPHPQREPHSYTPFSGFPSRRCTALLRSLSTSGAAPRAFRRPAGRLSALRDARGCWRRSSRSPCFTSRRAPRPSPSRRPSTALRRDFPIGPASFSPRARTRFCFARSPRGPRRSTPWFAGRSELQSFSLGSP